MIRVCVLALALLTLSGCSWLGWFGKSDEQSLLETGSTERTKVPPELDQPPFSDPMPIPEVVDYRGLADQDIELQLPDALSTTFGVEQIVIRRLGDNRWVFLDIPLAAIWPQVVLFWEENHFPVAMVDPQTGQLETEWIVGTTGNPDEIYDSLTSGNAWEQKQMAYQYKFLVKVEPGVRSGSTELYIEEQNRPLGGFDDRIFWDGTSDNPELEGKMLSVLAYYLGDRTAQGPSISLVAATLQESKASLAAEEEGMVLRYRLDFDRAWATVGAALEDAKVEVEDLDRTSAVYYVYYSSRHDPDPGFFGRLFGRDGASDENSGSGNRFRVQLESELDEIKVTVDVDDELAASDTGNLILKERLLKLIKEYST
ncbi:MAG: outer membrane protein assembly factor BamC [Candidatus Azotimanducaceae bacterium]|jgi:outer membrane protein assembly factor BamC